MSQIVQATCPGCRTVLRIPAAWLGQPFKCKHCGTVIQARARPATPPARSVPVALPVMPGPSVPGAAPARPAAPRPAAGKPFAFGNDAEGRPARRYCRRTSTLWIALTVLLVLLGIAGAAGYFAWPHLSAVLKQAASTAIAQDDGPPDDDTAGRGTTDGGTGPADTGRQGDTPKVAGKTTAGRDTGRRPDGGRRPGGRKPGGDLPGYTGPLPRRALVVSINNYVYANPINYGLTDPGARNVNTLLDQLTEGLRIPRDQMVVLSDAAGREARPTTSPVIRETVNAFLDTSRAQDRIMLFVVGHVVEIDGEVFLVPVDGDPKSKEGLIPFRWFYDALAACKARQKVLVLDTCRLNPTRGQERPGSGPMGDKLDALLKEPPPGVQVWSTCVGGQFSYEFQDGETNNGVFLDVLYEVLAGKKLEGTIQKAGDPLPLERLAEVVNQQMKLRLDPLGKVQTSRLTGAEAEGGAEPDPQEPRPPQPRLANPPGRAADAVALETLKGLLKVIDFPLLRVTKDTTPVTPEALPPFPRTVLEDYLKEDKTKTPLRDEIEKVRALLDGLARKTDLRDYYAAPADETRFKAEVMNEQTEIAKLIGSLMDALESLQVVGKEYRDSETKRWQANYDLVEAKLEMQVAYLLEYQSLLGQLRKELPPRDPKVHNGWRLASQDDIQGGDNQAKKLATKARKDLKKVIETYKDTPWAILAKREHNTALGLEWQPTK